MVAENEDPCFQKRVRRGRDASRVECVDMEIILGRLGIVRPGSTSTKVYASTVISFCDENVGEQTIPATTCRNEHA